MVGPNPIIPGFAPDPSVCRIGDTFFLVNSSFHVFPGLPVYASIDLKSWKHIGNAINRPSQLSLHCADTKLTPLDGGAIMLATGGLYAPTIRHHNGITYIICTNILHHSPEKEETQNFIIHTADIWSGQWSDPMYYDFRGIDPSLLFDDSGKVYVQGCKTPDCHIYNFEIDLATGTMVTEPRLIWTGWDKRWTEGPHIYKKDGWYYLLCAEGGTFEFHMVSMARSRSIWGPYKPYEYNPVWTASGTNSYVQNTGHADLFQDNDGSWWMALLGVRSRGGRYVMGRESFLVPIEWPEEGWPTVRATDTIEETSTPVPSPAVDGVDWVYLRDPELSRYDICGRDITIRASRIDLTEPKKSVAFIGRRQRLLDGECHVKVVSMDHLIGKKVSVGLALYKDEHRYVSINVDLEKGKVRLLGLNKAVGLYQSTECRLDGRQSIDFRIQYTEKAYSFSFGPQGKEDWTLLGTIDTFFLTGMDFTGPLLGIYAVGDEIDVAFRDFMVDLPATQPIDSKAN
ncbi:putative xylanase 35 [Thozetella sp. PMI_491]|nr:putative xylanase 35 [Thozetella sp. PMI_491]